MYTSNKDKYNRPRANLAVRTNGPDWRSRPNSPSSSTDYTNMMKRTVSPVPDNAYGRRPLSSGASQSVASLQQHHKWLMQQQQQDISSVPISRNLSTNSQNYRSVSPIPSKSTGKQQRQYNDNNQDVVFDDSIEIEDERNDVEEERMVIIQDMRAKSPSINRGSGGSIMSAQQPTFYHNSPTGSQEFKIVKEGWLYRKNGLMQWKPVYAVAKHGNAVRPGGLYLYKDVKCTNHIHTYDMSEVLEISPRAQEYKQGIKWEFRMLVKRDDVMLATDDMLSRKDWIDSLTSIMGKVSIATQIELTSRIQTSEQMNRDLQSVAEDLDDENSQLKQEIQALKDEVAKKDKFYQQELQNREAEFIKKERLLQQELQDREEELDRQRQALETKCEVFEREATQWRNKYTELEKSKVVDEKQQAKMDALEMEIRKWRSRVDELEHQAEYRNFGSQSRNSSYENNHDLIKETMSDVKFNLQVLKDQIKSSSSEGSLQDIKSSVGKLCDSLDDAKMSWNELQHDIVKFLETEKEDNKFKESSQKHMIELLRKDFVGLRQEVTGVSSDDEEEQEDDELSVKKTPSLSEKFDILIEMIENVQVNQTRLASSLSDNNSSSSSENMPNTPTSDSMPSMDRESGLVKVVTEQLSEWMEESREIQSSTLTKIENSLRQNRTLPSVPTNINRLHEDIIKTLDKVMAEITQNQKQCQEEQGKNIKIIGNYLQLISNDIQESSIPDLSALSQQLEDVVDRLNSTEERLSLLHDIPMPQQDTMSFHSIANLSEDDKLSQLYQFVKNTERFMERSLRILNRYGDNPNGMEETIRRAVKGASKTQLEEILNLQEQNNQEKQLIEKKMERYQDSARSYFEKSMEKMHSDLHEFTGVMYEMLERLVLQALGHASTTLSDGNDQQKEIALYGKLSGANQVLKVEIDKLGGEKEQLEKAVSDMRQMSKELERQVDQYQAKLASLKSEYERVNADIHKTRQEGASKLARELEPLMEQITKLRTLAAIDESPMVTNSRGNGLHQHHSTVSQMRYKRHNNEDDVNNHEEEIGRNLSFQDMLSNQNDGRRNSHFSDSDTKPTIKSPLIGSRDRPRRREKSPLAGYLNRNN